MQLLRITTTPAQMEFSAQAARLQYHVQPLGFNLTKTGGSLEIHSQNIRAEMNSDNYRASLDQGSFLVQMEKSVQLAKRAGTEAVGRHTDLGNQVAQIHKGANIPDILFSRMMQDKQANLVLVPLAPIQVSWNGPEQSIQYTPVKQNFDWQIAKNVMEFVPGKFSIEVKQYPAVHIEYLGGPNYFPPRHSQGEA